MALVTAAEQSVGHEGIRDRLERLRELAAEELGRWPSRRGVHQRPVGTPHARRAPRKGS